jgi:hypothetical protein
MGGHLIADDARDTAEIPLEVGAISSSVLEAQQVVRCRNRAAPCGEIAESFPNELRTLYENISI